MLPLMNVCLIINPNAGNKQGLTVAGRVAGIFSENGIYSEPMVSTHPGGTREIAEGLDLTRWDAVVAVGGDGTLFEVINGMSAVSGVPGVPIGQIPVGTGNSFIRDLDVHSVEDAAARIVAGGVRKIDLGHFTSAAGSFFFINLLGAGFVSNVAYRARKYKRLGSLSYLIGVFQEVIGLESTGVTLNIDGTIITRDCVFVEVCNSRFTGGNMMMAPGAELDDGLLDVVLLNKIPRRTLLRLLPTIFSGKHVDAPVVEVFRGRHIALESEKPLALTPDGETFGETPIDVTVRPRVLEIFA